MLGDIIKTLRLSHNLSQVQLAKSLSVSKQTVSNWENNNILPSIDMLVKLSDFSQYLPIIFWSWITENLSK